ncbi:5-formyltetrahydrofolate cyclo-ligase [Tumebacillus algifaecis]|uniref:5-formyltetrahydrofolate cyclo-ligase n=1 Tax=Tumebacillus algifaecis TaxID=1214604 RepID=A0A223D5N0_9BACL|nr:5-formyltetrahydrofolate cyclo-ligase [Tumebacillus algifaecis]ASS76787.1 5-formyltetrahydrofolate cyclo-ligase [Tumebacillus algifaecis]
MEKKELRQRLLAERQAMSLAERTPLDRAILQRLTALPEVQAAKTILLYLDFRGEVESDGMIEACLAAGKTVCAPVTIKAERKMIPVLVSSLQELRAGAYGIREPIYHPEAVVPVTEIDLVVLPGVGFDRSGGRLGYGGGYYDRFLPTLRPDVTKIAVAYELQVVDQIPIEPHDTMLDLLVTENGVWRRV